MVTYKLTPNPYGDTNSVLRSDGWNIPFDPANTDYANLKLDLADGVELQDADGNTMSPEEVAEFLATLP